MRMPRETCNVVLGPLITKIIEQKKWIEIRGITKSEGAAKFYTRSLDGGLGGNNAFYWSNGHEYSSDNW